MDEHKLKPSLGLSRIFTAVVLVLALAGPVAAEGYGNALNGVKGFDAVVDFSNGNPKFANVVFWAVRDSYANDTVKALTDKPKMVLVFHGPAVKLISSDKSYWNAAELAEVEKFQATLREMKAEGVGMEICLYAAKVLGVDPQSIIPEIDRVGNGFVSVVGYQMQGYAVVRIP